MPARRVSRRCSTLPETVLPGDMHPVLRRVYATRAIESAQDLEYSLDRLLPPAALGGMTAAVGLLEQAIEHQWRIIVVGDFDADGATSTALCVRALRMLGAGDARRVMLVSIGTQWGLFLPLAFVIGPVLGYGLLGVWLWQGITRCFQVWMFITMWRGRKWQHITV